MSQKRLRIFAGPNGSGKTTILSDLKNKISFGVYINADDIQDEISKNFSLNLRNFELQLSNEIVQDFFRKSTFSPIKLNKPDLWQYFSIENSTLLIKKNLKPNAYIAADIAELLRQNLLKAGISFTYETVMSHTGKLSFFQKARDKGYRVYLYYIATEDPEINVSRVNVRVALKGHGVDPDIIRKRFFKSLNNLRKAVLLTDRSYIFDNSGVASKLVAEVTEGKDVKVFDPEIAPNWFIKYLAEK